jgi:MFS family permease
VYAIRRLPRLTARPRGRRPRLQVRAVLQGRFRWLLAAAVGFELGNAAATLLILRVTNLLTPTYGVTHATEIALLLYTAYNAAAAVSSLPAGQVDDRRGSTLAWTLGAVALLAGYALLADGSPSIPLLTGAFILAGVGIGFAETAQSAAVAAAAPIDQRGSAFGILAAIQAFGNLAASIVAGVIWTLISPAAAFLYLSCWMVVAVVVLLTSRRNTASTVAL